MSTWQTGQNGFLRGSALEGPIPAQWRSQETSSQRLSWGGRLAAGTWAGLSLWRWAVPSGWRLGCFCSNHRTSGKVTIRNRRAGHPDWWDVLPRRPSRTEQDDFLYGNNRRVFTKDVTLMPLLKKHPAHYYKYLITAHTSRPLLAAGGATWFISTPFFHGCAPDLTRKSALEGTHLQTRLICRLEDY